MCGPSIFSSRWRAIWFWSLVTVGSEGHFLQRLNNINQPVLRTSLNDARTIAQRQPWPAYGTLQLP